MSFQEKIKSLTPGTISVKEYRTQIWEILIACGGALKDQSTGGPHNWGSFYGECLDIDHKLTTKILSKIKKYGIDWNINSDPASHVESRFNGTFNPEELYISFLTGRLFLKNGEAYNWGANVDLQSNSHFDDDLVFGRLIQTITQLELTVDDILEELERRLQMSEWSFEYSCKIPLVGT